ncbi:MAG: 2OG-Fe(II) oxygenase superfamily protein [Betaproteobacteria bacterium]|nr:2OG-Fe(II) oxygenase superfamily protein [Betaproteobacteria bacterium]
MALQVKFSDEFRQWLLHNIERGCAADDMVQSMVAQKFEPRIARGLVEAFQRARRIGATAPSGSVELEIDEYLYETPRLAPGTMLRAADREVPVLLRLERPALAVLEGVLSAEECGQLIELARGRMRPSTVVDPVTGEDKTAQHRDSEGMFFRLRETSFIARLDERISQLMNCPVEHGEGLQMLRYGPGAKTTPHYDFLAATNQANRESIARSGQRISTLVIYLNDVKQGGETVFPEIGLAVAPRRGNAVYFEYANRLHQVDHQSVHAGAAVHAGEKWAVTKWMRERPFVSA